MTDPTRLDARQVAEQIWHACLLKYDWREFDVDRATEILATVLADTSDATRLLMMRELDYAIHGAVIARPDTPEFVWVKLLEEVVSHTTRPQRAG